MIIIKRKKKYGSVKEIKNEKISNKATIKEGKKRVKEIKREERERERGRERERERERERRND